MGRRINAAGLALVKQWEALRLTAYKDTGGVLTIGYGHTGPDVKAGWTITEDEANRLLRDDLAKAESAVSRFVTVPLTDDQFAALVSFTFNVGIEAFRTSTLRKKLNAGGYDAVPGQLRRWVHDDGRLIQGLVNRRNAEIELWNTPDASPSPTPDNLPSGAPVRPVPSPRATVAMAGIAAVVGAAVAWGEQVWHWLAG